MTQRRRRAGASFSTSSKRSSVRNYFPVPEFEALWHGYEVDAFYEDYRLIIELDGYRDHSEPDRFEADRERDALAIELEFDTLRITWKRLKGRPCAGGLQLRDGAVAVTGTDNRGGRRRPQAPGGDRPPEPTAGLRRRRAGRGDFGQRVGLRDLGRDRPSVQQPYTTPPNSAPMNTLKSAPPVWLVSGLVHAG